MLQALYTLVAIRSVMTVVGTALAQEQARRDQENQTSANESIAVGIHVVGSSPTASSTERTR